MIWDVFEPLHGISNPAEPGKYLGSVKTPDTYEHGINKEDMMLDLHLRKTGRKAYAESYGLVTQRKPYAWRGQK